MVRAVTDCGCVSANVCAAKPAANAKATSSRRFMTASGDEARSFQIRNHGAMHAPDFRFAHDEFQPGNLSEQLAGDPAGPDTAGPDDLVNWDS